MGTRWDGQKRAETLWIDYLGAPDTPYHRETAKLFLSAAIARLFSPGHKFDYVPVLISRQGTRKSTFIETLAFEKYYGELTRELTSDKDTVEEMLGKWIMEMGELVSMRKSDVESAKAFISRKTDRTRLSYDRRAQDFPRQCVFMGSTNRFEFLKDDENRRFWPIPVSVDVINTDRLASEVDQIWAEALTWYRDLVAQFDFRKIPLMLSAKADREARRMQEGSRIESLEDQMAGVVDDFLNEELPLSQLINGHESGDFLDRLPADQDEPRGIRV